MDKEKQIDIVSKYHAKNDLANALYLKQDEFDLSNPFEVANCVINLGYRKINENEIVISKREHQRYCAYKIIEPQIKGCLDRERALEKQLEMEREEKTELLKALYLLTRENACGVALITKESIEEISKKYGVEIGETK